MLQTFKNGQTSIVLRVKLLDSSSTTGAGLTGLSSASSGLIISTIADNEATATAYTVAGSTVETITTLGTYAAPTATKCRFKEVDSTNHKGVYELQFADARFAVASSKSLLVSVAGATNLAQADFVVQLQSDDPFVAKPTNSNLLSIDANGRIDVIKLAGTTQTARDIGASVLLSSGVGTGQISLSAGLVTLAGVTHTGAVIPTVTTLTNLPSITANWLTAAGMDATASAEIADQVWDEVLSGHLTAGTTGNALNAAGAAGDPWSTSIPGAYGAGTAGYIVGNNVNAALSTLATQTSVNTIDDFLDTEIAAIKAKTDNLPAAPAATGDIPTAAVIADAVWDEATAGHTTAGTFGEQCKTDIDSILTDTTSIQSDTNDIQTRVPAALVGGRMDSNLSAISGSTTTMAAFNRAVKCNTIGTVGVGSTTTSIVTSSLTPAGTAADQFKGKYISFADDTTTAALRGQSSDITASTASATPTFTVTALTTAPASGDTFSIT